MFLACLVGAPLWAWAVTGKIRSWRKKEHEVLAPVAVASFWTKQMENVSERGLEESLASEAKKIMESFLSPTYYFFVVSCSLQEKRERNGSYRSSLSINYHGGGAHVLFLHITIYEWVASIVSSKYLIVMWREQCSAWMIQKCSLVVQEIKLQNS